VHNSLKVNEYLVKANANVAAMYTVAVAGMRYYTFNQLRIHNPVIVLELHSWCSGRSSLTELYS